MKKSLTVSGLVDSGTIQEGTTSNTNLPKFKKQADFTESLSINIDLKKIEPNPYQPRKLFLNTEIEELASSISEIGLIQPISVRKANNDGYQIIAGERRFKAFQLLGKPEIPCIVFSCDDSDMAVMAIAENVTREDLSDFEIAKAIKSVESLFPTKTKLAEALGFQREDMYRYFSFDTLPEFLIEKLTENPRLLSRNAASDIKRTLSKHNEHNELSIAVLKSAIDLLEKRELDQTKIAQFLSQNIKSALSGLTGVINKKDEFIVNGKKVGSFSSSQNGITIKFTNGIFDDNNTQNLQILVNNFLKDIFEQ